MAQDLELHQEDAGSSRLPALSAGAGREGAAAQSDAASLARSIRRPMAIGLVLILVFLVTFISWGTVVSLAGGAVAPGVISPDGSRRTVQHLEGGIIGELLVKEHDLVEAGQSLLVLQDVQARASHDMLRGQYRTQLATHSRLMAEQLGRDQVTFPEVLIVQADDPEVADVVRGQRQLFETRAASHKARKLILRQRIDQLHEQIKGTQAQVESASRQLAIIADEVASKEILFNKQLLEKPKLLELKRKEAEIQGDRGEYLAQIAGARQKIGETELNLLALDAERADEVAVELDKTRAQMAETLEKLQASADVLNRTVVTAPVSGRVVNLAFKTKGGVVKPGDAIMELVPINDELLIDARVSPTDVDVVHPNLPAMIHLSAFSSRRMPRIDGVVRSISADRLTDRESGQSYYLARIEVDREKLKRELGPDLELVPGMPAEVLIVTGYRTMVDYLMQPFQDVFRRALTEN